MLSDLEGMARTSDASSAPEMYTREDVLRGRERAKVRGARSSKNSLGLLLLLTGPGVLVMLGENDGPSMISYALTGATYGIGFFVPFIILTFFMAYIVQEMTVRIGIATRRGHAELIQERFGPLWGCFALGDLLLGNALKLVTEFIAIRAGSAYFGIPPAVCVGVAVMTIMLALSARNYWKWERAALVLAAGNLFFIPAALLAHPDVAALGRAVASWRPLPGGAGGAFFTLILANVGATITPWMLFFQQSAITDKGLTRTDLMQGRIDTALGAALAALVAVATVVAAAPLFANHVDTRMFSSGADFAVALRPYIGRAGASLFALGMIEAGLLAAMTISTSSAYAVGEVLRARHSLNSSFSEGRRFDLSAFFLVAGAAAVTLLPHVPLLAIAIAVNVVATLIMPPALLLLLLLANDVEIMGPLSNSIRQNVWASVVTLTVALLGAVYGFSTLSRLFQRSVS